MHLNMASKWLQKGLRSKKNEDQKRSLFWVLFSNHFWLISEPQMPPNAPQNRSNTCLGAPRAPQGRHRPAGGLQEALLEPFGTHFRPIWGQFLVVWGLWFWLSWLCWIVVVVVVVLEPVVIVWVVAMAARKVKTIKG